MILLVASGIRLHETEDKRGEVHVPIGLAAKHCGGW